MEGALIEQNSNVLALSDHELVAHLAGIIEASDDAITSSNLEGRLLSWNRGATRLYGWAAVDALTTDRAQLIPAELREFEDRIVQRVLRGGLVEHYDTQRRRRDGSLVEVAITTSATRNSAGRISGVAEIARNLGESRKAELSARGAEEQLSQVRRLEAVGTLAGEMAHDFNNLLSIIMTYSSLVLEELEPDSPLRSDLIEVCQAAGRAGELTRRLLATGKSCGSSDTIPIVEADARDAQPLEPRP